MTTQMNTHTDLAAVANEAMVVPVGTFAAGQSDDGEYVAVTAAPQGTFAEGQAESDVALSPHAPLSRAD